MGHVLVGFDADAEEQRVIEATLDRLASVRYLADASTDERKELLRSATVLLAGNLRNELREDEYGSLASVEFIQILPAGANRVPFARIRDDVSVASNVGAYAEPMAEHVLGMILTLAKNLTLQNQQLLSGGWDQERQNRMIHGLTAGILGFGGIGRATAKLLRPFDMRIMAVNRTGAPEPNLDFTGSLDALKTVLRESDVVVVCLPLTKQTTGLLDRERLSWMKSDAILINVARGGLIEEDALYERAKACPEFKVGLDVWWNEPFLDGEFHTTRPILELPNVIGSPHNSANVPGMGVVGVTKAAENISRFLYGEPVTGLVDRSEYA